MLQYTPFGKLFLRFSVCSFPFYYSSSSDDVPYPPTNSNNVFNFLGFVFVALSKFSFTMLPSLEEEDDDDDNTNDFGASWLTLLLLSSLTWFIVVTVAIETIPRPLWDSFNNFFIGITDDNDEEDVLVVVVVTSRDVLLLLLLLLFDDDDTTVTGIMCSDRNDDEVASSS